MRNGVVIILTVLFSLAILEGFALAAKAEDVPRMTKEELKGMLENPDVIIIDVRAGGDWNDSKQKIKRAVREDPRKVSSWIDKYSKDKTFLFY